MEKLRFTKWDMLSIGAVAALAAAVFFLLLPAKTPAASVEIYQNGVLVQRLSLNEDASFCIEREYSNVITVRDGKVAVTESSCPGGDCKNCGWLGTAGSIVCLPNRVEVRLVGAAADVDIVVG